MQNIPRVFKPFFSSVSRQFATSSERYEPYTVYFLEPRKAPARTPEDAINYMKSWFKAITSQHLSNPVNAKVDYVKILGTEFMFAGNFIGSADGQV
jgi:hypothetical protein